eukprot:TRINITY_DN7303_c0_g1_i5.p1 TRINITY_DN7303_c0_g1~~TRINITY_DN7303_c0_g1_i5.p1  ORF type:complete len:275 (+),score=101.94 TRINITY_DN7303_c0_g1_i5:239-1063(+)
MPGYKVVICGDGAIGKTCLLDTLLEISSVNWADPEYIPTAAENQRKTWDVDDVGDVEIEFWDTAGQEALACLRTEAYHGTDVLLLGFDMSSGVTLENVCDSWIHEFRDECSSCEAIILVGTKFDLFEERGGFGADDNVKSKDAVIEAGLKIGAHAFIATSAKTSHGILLDAEQDFVHSVEGINLRDTIRSCCTMLYNNSNVPHMLKELAAPRAPAPAPAPCLLYTSDAADEEDSVDLGGRRIIKKKKKEKKKKKKNIEQKIIKENKEYKRDIIE